VLDQLRLGGRAGREVEQQRIACARRPVRRERGRLAVGVGVVEPSRRGLADGDPGVAAGNVRELARVGSGRDDMAGAPALDPVDEVFGAEQRGRGNDHRPELHRREDGLPQLDLVSEHQDQPVAAGDAVAAQPVRQLPRASGELRE